MYLSYDDETGAIYISFIPEDAGFVPRRAISLEDVEDLGDSAEDVILDVDEEGRLVGLEVLTPDLLLRSETLGRLRHGG